MAAQQPAGVYAERLSVPVAWWLIAGFFLLSFWLAIGFYLGWWQGLLATAVLGALVAWVLLDYGSVRIRADSAALSVGRARIEWQWVASVRPLGAAAARERQGPGADARAYLVLRSYLRGAVEVRIDDPADPHPYWLISCRHPEELARAATAQLTTHRQ